MFELTPADLTQVEELRTAAARLSCEHTHPIRAPHSIWAPGPCPACGAPFASPSGPVPEPLRTQLAGWLRDVADDAVRHGQEFGNHPDEIADGWPLTIARTINGDGRG